MSTVAERTGPEPAAAASNTAILARALLARTVTTFHHVPEAARGLALHALDRFLVRPSPAAYVAAAWELRETRRRFVLDSRGRGVLRRALAAGAADLHEVPTLPSAVADRLAADLPADALTGQRLQALVALAHAYEELASRVAADTAEMRRRYQAAPRKRRPRGLWSSDKRR